MLRKVALAVGAVALCGAVEAQAGTFYGFPGDGKSYNNDYNKGHDDYKGDMGDGCGCVKIVVPTFDGNCEVVKWINTLDTKKAYGNVFDELVDGHNPHQFGLWLPKNETKILGEIQHDVKEYDKDEFKLDHDHNDYCETKDLRREINCDLTDIRKDACEFAGGLKDICCHDDHHGCEPTPTTTAVPLPAAASQGLVGMALLGCIGLVGAARRRVFGRA